MTSGTTAPNRLSPFPVEGRCDLRPDSPRQKGPDSRTVPGGIPSTGRHPDLLSREATDVRTPPPWQSEMTATYVELCV